MKKNSALKMSVVVLNLVLGSCISLFAANFNNDETVAITPPISGSGKIVRVTVHFRDNIPGSIASASLVNTGIALAQDSITAYAGYSTYARFDNASDGKGVIDARNGGAIGTPANQMPFELGKSYYVWFTLDLTKSTYSVSAQDATTSTVVSIAADYSFRFSPITSVRFASILHNGDNGDGAVLKIDEVTYPASIIAGPLISAVTSVKSLVSGNEFKPNQQGDEVRFNRVVKSAEIIDLKGNVIGLSSNVSTLNLAHVPQGVFLVKTEAGIAKIVK